MEEGGTDSDHQPHTVTFRKSEEVLSTELLDLLSLGTSIWQSRRGEGTNTKSEVPDL